MVYEPKGGTPYRRVASKVHENDLPAGAGFLVQPPKALVNGDTTAQREVVK
jgi:hypothetical protein